MYTLHIANKNYSSWSLRPWILMKELQIPFIETISPFKDASNWTEFREFSPTGLVPCLVDGDLKVWDSLAITEYLAELHVTVWPEQLAARAWARCATAEMHSGFMALRNQCPMNCGVRVTLSCVNEALQNDLSRIDELWNDGLRQFNGPFLSGNTFTAVDAFFIPVAFRVRTYGLGMSEAALKYIDRVLSLDSVLEWEQAALSESWREQGHEEDSIAYGVLTDDFRTT